MTVMQDGLYPDGGGQMGFTGTRSANQDDILRILNKLAAMERPNQRLVDRAFRKIKAGQVTVRRKAGGLHLIVDGADFPLCHFGL